MWATKYAQFQKLITIEFITQFEVICRRSFQAFKSFLSFFISVETSESDVQSVLIDCSSVTFVDVAGARLFIQVCLLKQEMMLLIYTLHMVLSISFCIVWMWLIDFGFLQMCSECQKVGVHVYLANCNGKAYVSKLLVFYLLFSVETSLFTCM